MTYWIDENAKEQRTQCNHIKYADVANNANNSSNNVCKGTINNNGICCNLWHVAFLCNAFRFIFETPSSKWRNKHVCVIYVCDGILFLTESNPLISDMCACVCSIKCTYTELDVIKEKQLLLPSLQIYFSWERNMLKFTQLVMVKETECLLSF